MANKNVYKTLQELDIPIEPRGFDSFTTCPLSLTDLQAIFDAGSKSANSTETDQDALIKSLENERNHLKGENNWYFYELDRVDALVLKYERTIWCLSLVVFILLCVVYKLH